MLISVVTTLYRSSPYLDEFYRRTLDSVRSSGNDVEFIFVDDGSPDDSAVVARKFLDRSVPATLIELSRNFGHHRAILTGLSFARGEMIFLIDCDLEERPELFDEMLRAFEKSRETGEQADVVYAIPHRRKGGLFERVSGELFYKVFNLLSDVRIPNNWMICRLMTARYVRALVAHHERELFLGGLFGITGFRQIGITADKRHKGSTVWTLRRKLRVALEALTAFSARPLWFLAGMGTLISAASALAILYMIVRVTVLGMPYQSGWASIMVTISFFGGLNLLAIGLIGMYVAQIFSEVKRRPCIVKDVRANFAFETPAAAATARQATGLFVPPVQWNESGNGAATTIAPTFDALRRSQSLAIEEGRAAKDAESASTSGSRHA